jgi:hypothetical protein
VCLVAGILLLQGLIGGDPLAAQLRREAVRAGPRHVTAARDVPERVFRYGAARRTLATTIVVALGVLLFVLGCLAALLFPGVLADRVAVAAPLLVAGALMGWIAGRYPTLYVKVDPDGVEARMYFRSVRMPWADIVALIAREHHALVQSGFVSAGIVYSVYAPRTKLYFTDRLESRGELLDLLARTTSLEWRRG